LSLTIDLCHSAPGGGGLAAWQVFQRVLGVSVQSYFKMQHSLAAVIFSHICNSLACRDFLTFCDQPLLIMRIRTQQLLIVLDDYQLPVTNQAAATVNDFTRS
jgi:hypothetical protein